MGGAAANGMFIPLETCLAHNLTCHWIRFKTWSVVEELKCVGWKYDCWIQRANNGTAEIVPKATAGALVRDDGVIV